MRVSRRPGRPSALLLVVVLAGWLTVAAGEASAQSSGRVDAERTASLSVRISGLPPGVPARAALRGPGFSRVITRSAVLRRLRPGRYVLTNRQVRIARARSGLRAGSLALPSARIVRIRVKARRPNQARLSYGTIVNADTRRLGPEPLSVKGNRLNPSGLTLPARYRAGPGAILTAKPSSKLPAGLFHRVTSARRSGRRLELGLRPAHLSEAFSQVDIDSRVQLAPGSVAVGNARTAGSDPLVASMGFESFRCPLPVGDSRLSAPQRFDIDADVELHIPKKFSGPVGRPRGRLALTLRGSSSLDALVRRNTGCSARVQLPALPGAISVGPVVVPVYAQVGLAGSASTGGDLSANARASFTVVSGMTFSGSDVENISSTNAIANAGASGRGGGRIAVGPTIRLTVGAAGGADVQLDAKPSLAFTAALDRTCSLDVEGGSQVSISIGPLQLDRELPAPRENIARCQPAASPALEPAGPGGGGGGGTPPSHSGDGGSTTADQRLAAGGSHSCARGSTGGVVCWGYNAYGQLGDGSRTDRLTPVAVSGLGDVVEIAAGLLHSCARRATGSVVCWGNNAYGQLGDGSRTDRLTPVTVSGLGDAVEIAVDGAHSCARRATGSVVCWGYNAYAQLGDGSTVDRFLPVAVGGLGDAAEITAGDSHSCARRATGSVVCWGYNSYGQLGDGTTTRRLSMVDVAGLSDAVEITAAGSHSCARRATGSVVCWGYNVYGQLGNGTTTRHLSTVAVGGLGDAVEVTAGISHSCARRATGSVVCWGYNKHGRLGDGTTTDGFSPVEVTGLGDAAEITGGGNHSCARRSTRGVACWGYNVAGQLGDGSTADRLTPVAVGGLSDAG